MKRLIIQIFGSVQGVFFRVETQKKAKELNLVGWVENLEDGSVKIVAEGKEENLEQLKEWCKSGPGYARIEKMEEKFESPTGEFSNFEIKY